MVISPWSRVRDPASDITGAKSQRVGPCLCPYKGCGKSLRVSTSGGGGQGGMRDRGSESRWSRGGARAASGWWLGPNGKNSRSNLSSRARGGVCVGGRGIRPSTRRRRTGSDSWMQGATGEGERGRERGFPEEAWASDGPPSCPIGEICLGVWSWHRLHRLCVLVHIRSSDLRSIAPHRRQRRRTREKNDMSPD